MARFSFRIFTVALILPFALAACGGDGGSSPPSAGPSRIVVDTLEDAQPPPDGAMTLRAAVEAIAPGGTITFAPELDGGTISLSIAGDAHSVLRGEVFTMTQEGWAFQGFQERDYGKSALYAAKNLTIDASALAGGITLRWAGGDADRARVLAVYGDLTMRNVSVENGHASAEPIEGGTQPFTLGRGGALAVWGAATLEHCTFSGNRASGDTSPSRDRGAFGGGVYANILTMRDCIVAGNSVSGYGGAGGGIYSVGGADREGQLSTLSTSAVTGNRVTAQHAYGGGIYSDGGGPGNAGTLDLTNCTVARNLVEDNPDIAENDRAQYYYRGGGIYMSNGRLRLQACTVAENEVTGVPAQFSGKPNMGGGGVAATIGNAHVVEDMRVRHTILVGNRVNGAADDLFSGSLLHFYSQGYNIVGAIDFNQILVPIPPWLSLSRKHWPKIGDLFAAAPSEALALDAVHRHGSILSAGTDAGQPAVLWYPPTGHALDRIPNAPYSVHYTLAEYVVDPSGMDDFLNRILLKLRTEYADILGSDFGSGFGDLAGVTFHGPSDTWPTNPDNAEWIGFWRELDAALGERLGPAKLADDFWGSFHSGPLGENITLYVYSQTNGSTSLSGEDQLGNSRPAGTHGDIGAVEAEAR